MSPALPPGLAGFPRYNDVDLESDELGRDLGEALGASFRPAILDRDRPTLDPAEFMQSLRKSGDPFAGGRTRALTRKPNSPQLPGLLAVRLKRPRDRRAAEQGDELAATDESCHLIPPLQPEGL